MAQRPRPAWLDTAARCAGLLAVAALAGALAGAIWPAVALAALALLGWQLWRLQRLLDAVQGQRRLPAATGDGLVDALQSRLAHARRQSRRRKRRLLDLLQAYRAAADALPDAVVVVDRNTQRIDWFNQAAGALLGLRSHGDRGAALVPRLAPLPLAHWLASGRHAEPILDAASPVDPGTRLHLRLLPYSERHWLLVARDVTKLLQLERMRRDFVANVSHELRTPLTVIHGYLDMIEPEDFPATVAMVQEMRQQSSRMTQLVEDLLTLSRLENQAGVEPEVVAMAPLLATLAREARALGGGRHVVEVDDDGRIDLRGSARELHSAFSNLVGNAVRYTPDGGRIRISLAGDGHAGAVLAVSDSGPGIAAEHLPRLTERFYRVSTSRSRASGGTGLGLAIVKHILGLHHARLEIWSEVGSGSRFACHFDASHVAPRCPPEGTSPEHVLP